MNRRTDRRILKIFLPGFRIQSEISTDFPILQLQRIADSSTFWARILKNTSLCRSIDSFRYFWRGSAVLAAMTMFIVGAVLHSFRRRLPFQFHDLYRFEVKDFKTDMISNDPNGRTVHSMFLSVCFFFCSLIHRKK